MTSPTHVGPACGFGLCVDLGKNVLVTGATGFVGKVVLEKLLREFLDIGVVYVLIRPKGDKSPEERLRKEILQVPLFDVLREKLGGEEAFWAHVGRKARALPGDILQGRLGLSDGDFDEVTDNLHVVIHCAATISFSEPIPDALNQNVFGALRVMELAQACRQFQCLVHVSTCYVNSNRDDSIVLEKIYPMDGEPDPEALLRSLLDRTPEELAKNEKRILGRYPNSYTFSKALSELLLQGRRNGLPLVIVRPSIVDGIHRDPLPGWCDSLAAAGGMFAAYGHGILRFMPTTRPEGIADQVPVDHVSSMCIAAAAYYEPSDDVTVYHAGTSARNPISWVRLTTELLPHWNTNPTKARVMRPSFDWVNIKSRYGIPWHEIHMWVRWQIPVLLFKLFALTVGGASMRKRSQLMEKVVSKLNFFYESFRHFTENTWIFSQDNVELLMDKMTEDELERFCFDAKKIDWMPYFRIITWGLRRYAIGEKGLKPLLPGHYVSPPPFENKGLYLKRSPFGDMRFALNNPVRNNTLGRTHSQSELLLQVFASERVQRAMAAEAEAKGKDLAAVEARGRDIMSVMAADFDARALRLFAYLLRKVYRRLYTGIKVSETGLDAVKAAMDRGLPLLILPTHKSYVDFLVVSYIFYSFSMPVPHIASGDDFLNIVLVRWLFRCCGAYFMRRTLGDDELYRALFAEYSQTLLREGYPVEFFLEGTRSRSGKMLHPKTGLLSICLELYHNREVEDMLLVPVALSYDKLIDERGHISEMLGEDKQKPTISGLISAAREVLNMDYGRISVQFGTIISAHDYFESATMVDPREVELSALDRRSLCSSLALTVCHDQQAAGVTMSTSVVAAVLLTHRHGITRKQLVAEFKVVRGLISERGGWVDALLIGAKYVVARAIALLGRAVTEVGKRIVPAVLGPDRAVDNSSFMRLSYYRNMLLHLFVREGAIALVLARHGLVHSGGSVSVADVVAEAQFISDMLYNEFLPPRESDYVEQAISDMVDRGTLLRDGDMLTAPDSSERLLSWLCALFWPFIDSYWLVALSASTALSQGRAMADRDIVERAQWLGRNFFAEGALHAYESCSKETCQNALRRFEAMGLLKRVSSVPPYAYRLVDPMASGAEDFSARIASYRKKPVRELLSNQDITSPRFHQDLIAEFPVAARL